MTGRRGWKELLASEFLNRFGIVYDGSTFTGKDGNSFAIMDGAFDMARTADEAVALIQARLKVKSFRVIAESERKQRILESQMSEEEEKAKLRATISKGRGMVDKAMQKLGMIIGKNEDTYTQRTLAEASSRS